MSNNTFNQTTNEEVKCKITKTSYDKIVKNINDTWPQWKKNLCNQELIVSVNSKKL